MKLTAQQKEDMVKLKATVCTKVEGTAQQKGREQR